MSKIHVSPKYQLLMNKKEKAVMKHSKHAKAFIDYFQSTGDIYKNLENHNTTKLKKQNN